MSNKTISIIMPVYNTANYLHDSIGSVLKQTSDSWELVCVNDGSTDNSLSILNEYSNADGRIKVIDIKNNGPANARNVAISNATGDYIIFLDSDDTLEPNAIGDLLKISANKHYDIITFSGKVSSDADDAKWVKDALSITNKEFSNEDCVKGLLYEKGSTPFLWNKLIDRNLLVKNDIGFDISLTLGEDQAFLYDVFLHAKSIRFANVCLYNYRWQREGSLMNKFKKDKYGTTQNHLVLIKNVFMSMFKSGNLYRYSDFIVQWATCLLYNSHLKDLKHDHAQKLAREFWDLLDLFNLEKAINPNSWNDTNQSYYSIIRFMSGSLRKNKDLSILLVENASPYFEKNLKDLLRIKDLDIEIIVICLSKAFYHYAQTVEKYTKLNLVFMSKWESKYIKINSLLPHCKGELTIIGNDEKPINTIAIPKLIASFNQNKNSGIHAVVGCDINTALQCGVNIDNNIKFADFKSIFNSGNIAIESNFVRNNSTSIPSISYFAINAYALELLGGDLVHVCASPLYDNNCGISTFSTDREASFFDYMFALGTLGSIAVKYDNYDLPLAICNYVFDNNLINFAEQNICENNLNDALSAITLSSLINACYSKCGLFEHQKNAIDSIIIKLEEYDYSTICNITDANNDKERLLTSNAYRAGELLKHTFVYKIWRRLKNGK